MAEPRVGPALGASMRRQRDHLNALAAEARLIGGGFAVQAFTDALTGPVDTLATAVEEVAPAAVDTVVETAYRAALVLTGRRRDLCVRDEGRTDPLARTWAALSANARLVVAAPQQVIGSLSNAALAIDATPGARVQDWTDRIGRLGAVAPDADTWLRASRVAAWACGMAHHRRAGIAALEGMDPALAALAVTGGVTGSATVRDDDPLAGWDPADRWATPAGVGVVPRHDVGGFVGFGGPFTLLPVVWVDPEGILHATAGPGDGTWQVHADVFGSTLTRTADTPSAGSGTVDSWPRPPEPRVVTSAAGTVDTLAWTTSASYRIAVTGRRGGTG